MFKIANVIGVKEVEQAFGDIAQSFVPRMRSHLLIPGAEVIAEQARNNILSQGLVDSGDLYDAIIVFKVNQWMAGVKVDIVYGAVHEYGLENQVITPKQRSFFWAKFAQTGEPMWRALALSYSYTIPARPYLRPAIDSHKKEAALAVMHAMSADLTKRAKLRGHV